MRAKNNENSQQEYFAASFIFRFPRHLCLIKKVYTRGDFLKKEEEKSSEFFYIFFVMLLPVESFLLSLFTFISRYAQETLNNDIINIIMIHWVRRKRRKKKWKEKLKNSLTFHKCELLKSWSTSLYCFACLTLFIISLSESLNLISSKRKRKEKYFLCLINESWFNKRFSFCSRARKKIHIVKKIRKTFFLAHMYFLMQSILSICVIMFKLLNYV